MGQSERRKGSGHQGQRCVGRQARPTDVLPGRPPTLASSSFCSRRPLTPSLRRVSRLPGLLAVSISFSLVVALVTVLGPQRKRGSFHSLRDQGSDNSLDGSFLCCGQAPPPCARARCPRPAWVSGDLDTGLSWALSWEPVCLQGRPGSLSPETLLTAAAALAGRPRPYCGPKSQGGHGRDLLRLCDNTESSPV